MKTTAISLPAAAAAMMRELRRLRDTKPAAWDALVDARLCTAWDGMKAALAGPDPVRASLETLTLGFKMEPGKLDRHWSFGYWEGFDPGLVLVNRGEAPFLENTRFKAVIRFESETIKAAIAALEDTKDQKQEEKRP